MIEAREVSSAAEAGDWVPLARMMRPQGRRGELLAEPATDQRDSFAAGLQIGIAPNEAAQPSTETTLEEAWWPTGKNAGRAVVKLAGINSIAAAEALAGLWLMMRAADVPALPADTWFVRDLVGCTLVDAATDAPRGVVVDVEYVTSAVGRRVEDAPPLLVVETAPGAEPVLVPFASALLERVDLPRARIVMRVPDGLWETSAESSSQEATSSDESPSKAASSDGSKDEAP